MKTLRESLGEAPSAIFIRQAAIPKPELRITLGAEFLGTVVSLTGKSLSRSEFAHMIDL